MKDYRKFFKKLKLKIKKNYRTVLLDGIEYPVYNMNDYLSHMKIDRADIIVRDLLTINGETNYGIRVYDGTNFLYFHEIIVGKIGEPINFDNHINLHKLLSEEGLKYLYEFLTVAISLLAEPMKDTDKNWGFLRNAASHFMTVKYYKQRISLKHGLKNLFDDLFEFTIFFDYEHRRKILENSKLNTAALRYGTGINFCSTVRRLEEMNRECE